MQLSTFTIGTGAAVSVLTQKLRSRAVQSVKLNETRVRSAYTKMMGEVSFTAFTLQGRGGDDLMSDRYAWTLVVMGMYCTKEDLMDLANLVKGYIRECLAEYHVHDVLTLIATPNLSAMATLAETLEREQMLLRVDPSARVTTKMRRANRARRNAYAISVSQADALEATRETGNLEKMMAKKKAEYEKAKRLRAAEVLMRS